MVRSCLKHAEAIQERCIDFVAHSSFGQQGNVEEVRFSGIKKVVLGSAISSLNEPAGSVGYALVSFGETAVFRRSGVVKRGRVKCVA